jgi:hypothetical protein
VDATDAIEAYVWTDSRDGQLSTSPTFTTSALTPGNHTVTFEVYCANGTWSSAETTSVTVIGKAAVVFSTCPKYVTKNKLFTVAGSMSRPHDLDTSVYVKEYWQIGGKYKYRGQVLIPYPAGTTAFSAKISLGGKGKWKLFFYHKDYNHLLSESPNRYVTVR